MNCTEVVEKLPWLLNKTLPESERAGAIAHLRLCDACRQELNQVAGFMESSARHPDPDTIVRYVQGLPLPDHDQPEFEQHLSWCDSCRLEVDLARHGLAAMAGTQTGWRRMTAIAASLLFALAAASLGVLWKSGLDRETALAERIRGLETEIGQLRRPDARVRLVDLLPDSFTLRSAAAEAPPAPRVGAGISLTLLLNSQLPAVHRSCGLSLEQSGSVLWKADGIARGRNGDFPVQIPSGFLTGGAYRLVLDCAADARESYSFQFTGPPKE